MSDVDTLPSRPSGRPTYPQVRVRLSGTDGNVFMLIGKVGATLRRLVGDDAADTFNAAAYAAGTYNDVLRLARATVTVT